MNTTPSIFTEIYEAVPQPTWILFSLLVGLIVGSFLNVVINRTPEDETIMGKSHCPSCGNSIKPYDNIPVLSWILLKGKCRNCKTKISKQYPLVEAGTALAFLGIYLWNPYESVVGLLFWWNIAATSIALSVIDFKTLLLPHPITKWFALSSATGVALLWATGTFYSPTIIPAVIAAAVMGLIYFTIFALTGGMGWGDVRIAPTVGLISGLFGFGSAIVAFIAAFLLGTLTVIPSLVARKAGRKTKIPFGPFIIAGMWVAVLWGVQLYDWWMGLFGL